MLPWSTNTKGGVGHLLQCQQMDFVPMLSAPAGRPLGRVCLGVSGRLWKIGFCRGEGSFAQKENRNHQIKQMGLMMTDSARDSYLTKGDLISYTQNHRFI